MRIHYDNATPAQRRFIERMVSEDLRACQSGLVDEILKLGTVEGMTYEDIEMPSIEASDRWDAASERERIDILTSCDLEAEDAKKFSVYQWEKLPDELNEETINMIAEELERSIDVDPPEIFEWWLVSDYIARKLREISEPVLYVPGFGFWWGRTCSGQAISLDPTWWTLYQDALANVAGE